MRPKRAHIGDHLGWRGREQEHWERGESQEDATGRHASCLVRGGAMPGGTAIARSGWLR
jgi:hypothetical protein